MILNLLKVVFELLLFNMNTITTYSFFFLFHTLCSCFLFITLTQNE